MHPQPTLRAAFLASAALLAGACSTDSFSFHGGSSIHSSLTDGGDASVKVKRPGYSLIMRSEGKVTFADDESDVLTLAAGGEFELSEKLDGVLREYVVTADRAGVLTREYSFDGDSAPLDEAAKKWLAEALPRMFRESGFDTEARVGRLMARGGPERVLQEVDLAGSDYAKASYLGRLLETAQLDAAQMESALRSAGQIDSDYELRRALDQALRTQSLDAARLTQLLKTGSQIDSDYELAELLKDAIERLPADAEARSAWLAAARQLDSDYELSQAVARGLEQKGTDAAFAAALVRLATEKLDSNYELGQVLKEAAARGTDPELASAYLDGAAAIDSDYERRCALEGIARHVAADADMNRRYRELARNMGDYERGQALKALDDAMKD
jgi:hypothetical protein